MSKGNSMRKTVTTLAVLAAVPIVVKVLRRRRASKGR